jgi:hypothetical protein
MSQTRRDAAVQHTIIVKSGEDWRRFFLPHEVVRLNMIFLDEEGRRLDRVGSRQVEFTWYSVGSSFLNTNNPLYVFDTPTLVGGWVLETQTEEDGGVFTIVEKWPGPEIFRDRTLVKAYSLRIIPGDEALAEPKAYTFPDVSKL